MFESLTIGLPWFVVSFLSLAMAFLFGYSYLKTRNSTKTMFSISYLFASLTFLPHINPDWESILLIENLHQWGALPIITTITIVSLDLNRKIQTKTINKIFYLSIATTIFLTITSLPLPPEYIFQIISFISIIALTFGFIKKKSHTALMLLISISCFTIAGISFSQNLDILFICTCYVFAFIFTFLALCPPLKILNEELGTIFSLKKIIKETKKELKKSKEKLEKSAEMMRLFFEFAPDGIYFTDLSGTFIDGNLAAEKLTGYKREELIGKNFLELELLSKKELVKATKLLALNALRKETGPDDFTLKRKDGLEVTLEITTYPIKLDNKSIVMGMARDITEKKETQIKLQNYAKDLEEEVRKRTDALNKSRQQLQVYSEHLEEIVEERSRKLKTSEKLAAIGQAATMVGHDLRNPLQAIQTAHHCIEKQLRSIDLNNPVFQKSLRMLEIIDDSIEYANNIVLDLKDFSSDRKPEVEMVDVNDLVEESLSLSDLPKNVEIIKELAQVPKLELDKAMMTRVFVNIVSNGAQAMPNGGTFRVSTKMVNGFVRVSFEDSGLGISEETMKKLFTPFFTTKAQGMGMGLAICKKFVESNRGVIEAESKESKGSKFTIKLPC